jgi:transcription termination/antitermination protein NusG
MSEEVNNTEVLNEETAVKPDQALVEVENEQENKEVQTMTEEKVEESVVEKEEEAVVDNSSEEEVKTEETKPEEKAEEITADESAEAEEKPEEDNENNEEAEGVEGEEESAEPTNPDARWFIIQTYSSYEKKVKLHLETKIRELELENKILKVLIPEEDTVEIKDNRRVEKTKKMYPGYVFINMIMEEDVWYVVRSIPGVSRFIGSSMKPEPVIDKEMLRVLRQTGEQTHKKIEIDFEVDDNIRVVEGPFRGYTGNISEINIERGKVKVLISIFGRETPMELAFEQIEKTT